MPTSTTESTQTRRIYTSEDTGVESVTVISERPIALQIRIAGLVPATFEPSGSVVTGAIKNAVEHASGGAK